LVPGSGTSFAPGKSFAASALATGSLPSAAGAAFARPAYPTATTPPASVVIIVRLFIAPPSMT
jgi:hypothetical protein